MGIGKLLTEDNLTTKFPSPVLPLRVVFLGQGAEAGTLKGRCTGRRSAAGPDRGRARTPIWLQRSCTGKLGEHRGAEQHSGLFDALFNQQLAQAFRPARLGDSLVEALDVLVEAEKISPELAMKVLAEVRRAAEARDSFALPGCSCHQPRHT